MTKNIINRNRNNYRKPRKGEKVIYKVGGFLYIGTVKQARAAIAFDKANNG